MSIKIQQRRDTAATWTSINPILSSGEIGIESDTGKFKIGDGMAHWATLAYALTAGTVTGLATVATTGAYGDLTGKPTLGTAAAQPTSAFDAAGTAASAQSAAQAYADGKIIALVGSAPLALDTLQEIDAQLAADEGSAAALAATVAGKVDKSIVTTKGDIIVATGTATVARQPVGPDGQVLTADSAQAGGVKWATATAGAQALTRTTVKTANYTAVLWDLIPCDTSSAGFTVTLPAATAGKGRIAVKLVTAGNTLTIALTGTDHFNTSTGGPTTGSLTLANQGLIAESDGAGIWTITADDLPLSVLDTRYVQSANAAPLAQAGQTPSQLPLAPGTASVGSLAVTARADHVHASSGLFLWWGSGTDGDLTFDGTTTISGLSIIPGTTLYGTSSITPSSNKYTLSRSLFIRNMTVNAGVTVVVPTGMTLYVAGTLTNNGTITMSGNDASGATAGTAATAMSTGTFGPGAAGGAGGTGAGSATASSLSSYFVASFGGSGGAGSSGAGGSGTLSQAWSALAGVQSALGTPTTLFTGLVGNTQQARPLGGGNGGGGGGGDGTNTGGGGGGGAGVLIINARAVVNAGTIKTNGGNGAAGTGGNAGGGGGGGAGAVIINTTAYTNTGTVTANGGSGGAGSGTGTAGSAGAAGPVIATVWA